MKVKKHWKNNQNLIRDFTALKTPIKTQPKIALDNITILKNKIKELRNRLHELVDRRI